MKTYLKTIGRTIRANAARLVSVLAIILLGIAFVSGLGTLTPTIEESFAERYRACGVADVIVKSTDPRGFTFDEIESFAQSDCVEAAQPLTAAEFADGDSNTRVYVLPDGELSVNRPFVLGGRLPATESEIAVEQASDAVKEYRIGDTLELMGKTFEVSGIVANPLLFTRDGEPDSLHREPLTLIAYARTGAIPAAMPVTDLYLKLKGAEKLGYFTDDYRDFTASRIGELKKSASPDKFVYLSLEQNKSYLSLVSYCDKVSAITLIFPVFFIAVAALVVLTTMTRMIEEERPSVACAKTLGVSDFRIVLQYVLISALCCILASAAGLAIGLTLLPKVIYPAFNAVFLLPPASGYVRILPGLLSVAAMLAAVTAVTAIVAGKEIACSPAALLRPKAPKAGKTILLERITFIWRALSFRMKSSLRNIFRRLTHLVMTLLSVAGSTALVFAGFALSDVAKSLTSDSFAGMADSLASISVMIIVFALLLCAFVVYNLTNMNVAERKREIATLKVLGYFDGEVTGYIFREVFLTAIFGILIGIALGCGLIQFILVYLDFGSIADVAWYSYLASGGLVLAFIGLVDLLLAPKILGVDMITSLKSVD